jgi:hypothetical protein
VAFSYSLFIKNEKEEERGKKKKEADCVFFSRGLKKIH